MVLSLEETPVKRISTNTYPSNRTLRFIYSANRHHAIPLFVTAKLMSLNFLYYESVLNLMHDIDERNAAINILNLFSRTSNSHHYSTRSSTSEHFYIKKSWLKYTKECILLCWRKDMEWLCQIALKTLYQRRPSEKKIKGTLLHMLKTEDNY